MNAKIDSSAIVRFAQDSKGKTHEFPSGIKVTARVDKSNGNISVELDPNGNNSPHIGRAFQNFNFDPAGKFPEGLTVPKGRRYSNMRGAIFLLGKLEEATPVKEKHAPSFIPWGKTTRYAGSN